MSQTSKPRLSVVIEKTDLALIESLELSLHGVHRSALLRGALRIGLEAISADPSAFYRASAPGAPARRRPEPKPKPSRRRKS